MCKEHYELGILSSIAFNPYLWYVGTILAFYWFECLKCSLKWTLYEIYSCIYVFNDFFHGPSMKVVSSYMNSNSERSFFAMPWVSLNVHFFYLV